MLERCLAVLLLSPPRHPVASDRVTVDLATFNNSARQYGRGEPPGPAAGPRAPPCQLIPRIPPVASRRTRSLTLTSPAFATICPRSHILRQRLPPSGVEPPDRRWVGDEVSHAKPYPRHFQQVVSYIAAGAPTAVPFVLPSPGYSYSWFTVMVGRHSKSISGERRS